MYVYSVADELIHWRDVEMHAAEAETKGYRVRLVKYVDSGHAAHLLSDEDRYWSAVMGVWDSEYLSSPGLIVGAW